LAGGKIGSHHHSVAFQRQSTAAGARLRGWPEDYRAFGRLLGKFSLYVAFCNGSAGGIQ
jgi:hypothetical protein